MEKRKETLSGLKVCRFCLTTEESLIPLYDKIRPPKNSIPFALKILACIAIEIFPSDNMPQFICQRCKFYMELSYAFKQLCRQADESILQFIQNGTPLAAMPWPSQLRKVYKTVTKSMESNVVKTINVQDGTTVKLMAEEVSDSEEGEDDNVFNVKIGDGTEEGKSIKIITSVDQPGTKDCEEVDGDGGVVAGCWPCDECECTYPLEQLLTLHKAQKHRARNEICDECGGRFFSRNDLEVHLLTHTSEMPFQCVACFRKFKRLILLKRHEKMMHSDLPQQNCPSCPATFLSAEELEAHQMKHGRLTIRPFTCYTCSKSFPNKAMLQRHTSMVHNKKSAFSCQYCPEQFPSVAKLTRHVREHAGVRPYPCKHCDKSFTKSHHYTRHLRVKHASSTRVAGAYVPADDEYRCEECGDTFSSQDDLMYHSALHATTNLVCPLCQEKFQDVEQVTAHIKSHANGTEYMCDFCELIFMSKEKLDNHIARSHDDELLANDQETEHDESSMDMEADEDDDNSINVKEENGQMVVEIKKAGEFMLSDEQEDKGDNTQSEDSDIAEVDSPTPEVVAMNQTVKEVAKKQLAAAKPPDSSPAAARPGAAAGVPPSPNSSILRKAEDVKRKAAVLQQQPPAAVADKKEKAPAKVATSAASPAPSPAPAPATAPAPAPAPSPAPAPAAPSGASDKSLRLLEKELQDLKRTNSRTEAAKTPAKPVESLRSRRPQLFTSTPKPRIVDKKDAVAPKSTPDKTVTEKKVLERKGKEIKDTKEVKSNNNTIKEDKELKSVVKDDKEVKGVKDDKEVKGTKDDKEQKINKEDKVSKEEKKDNSKLQAAAKNGAGDSPADDPVRRSARPSKVKDYAKMIRDNSLGSDDDDTDMEENGEDYKELEKTPDSRPGRGRRSSNKPPPSRAAPPAREPPPAAAAAAATPRKRGRPRKEPKPVVPSKIKKDEPSAEDAEPRGAALKENDAPKDNDNGDGARTPEANKLPQEPRPGVIMSPSGQTLKKVPIKALPPGVKPLPLPVTSRMGGGEVTEMQIGKKIVKVQKIVMTKAEVEAMTKKGLLEIKDGTMVLKQGIKLPAADPAALKSSLVGEGEANKESPKPASAPTRCELEP